ncbi:MAG: DUF3316 domain-containing protein [Muribaculaceae bacterium]|nr:DUF3316 domain-containing protein [Muribaculaceae bacterium]
MTFLIFISLPLFSQIESKENQDRPVTGYYSLEMGRTTVRASYLSPLTYSGTSYGISGNWSKALPFCPENAIMNFDGSGAMSSLLNPAKTAQMIGLIGEFSWSMEWRKRLNHNFQVTAGGGPSISGGAYYLIRNSNNPVEILANFSLQINASASKHFKIGRLPLLVTDRIRIPFIGVFFSPGYGETYYEIYLGNHKGLAHAGWWGNNFRLDNLLSVTLDFGRTAMEIGYHLNVYNQWANNLNTTIISNAFVIGVIPHGIGLKKRSRANYSIY